MNFGRDSGVEIEQILKRKVDSDVVKEFLNTAQNAFGENNYSVNSATRLKKYSDPKEIKINLLEEYKVHLTAVSKLRNFASMKMYMDHCFFKVFMPEDIVSNQGAVFDFTSASNDENV